MGLTAKAGTALREGGPLVLAGQGLRHVGVRLMVAAAVRKLARERPAHGNLEQAVEFVFGFHAGDVWIAPLQVPEEITRLLRRLGQDPPRRVLEIGTAAGGTLFLLSEVSRADATLVSVDLPGGPFGGGYSESRERLYSAFARERQRLVLIRGDSHDPATRLRIQDIYGGEPIDFLFIDGDHSREGVEADFEEYVPLVRSGGLIALHDIARGSPQLVGGVPDFWEELKRHYEGEEIVEDPEQGGYGIGLIRKGGG